MADTSSLSARQDRNGFYYEIRLHTGATVETRRYPTQRQAYEEALYLMSESAIASSNVLPKDWNRGRR